MDGPKFFLLHKNTWWSGWEFVKGDIIPGDSVSESVIKCVKELTGLNVTKIDNIPFNYSYNYLKGEKNVDASIACFVAKTEGAKANISKDYDFYKWGSFETVMKLLDFEEQKKLLEFIDKKVLSR
ncbi:Uncharacterised protein [Candidatus Tiddalikarchaeum anstoanum]|nr:Uncharacterised protein [Candidatus Tiddalikarchaeum anstoanum]